LSAVKVTAEEYVELEALPVNAPVNEVEETEVNPASVVDEAPRDIAVVPIVREELASFAFVTAPFAIVVAIDVVPLPVTSPERVIVWLPVKYVLVSSDQVSVAVFFKNPDVPERASIAVRSG